jgi:hypothetical protein
MTEYLNKQALLEWLDEQIVALRGLAIGFRNQGDALGERNCRHDADGLAVIKSKIQSGAFDVENSELQRLKKERDEARQKAEDAWKEIEELEDRLLRVSDRWISVKEPPKNGQRVLIWYRKGKAQDVAESRFANGGYIGFWDSEVTHWMPMPEPPRGG